MKRNKKHKEEPIPFDGTALKDAPIPDIQPSIKSNKKKKIAVICVVLICLLGGICWYFVYANPNALNQTFQDIRNHITGMYGSRQSYIYYPIDHDLDITTVEGYMELDRDIHYKNGSETVMITDANSDFYSQDVLFFRTYFDYAIHGNYEAYNALFTEHYYETNEPYHSFTQQMIYDIEIEKLSETNNDRGKIYAYNVSYKIYRNNGTFRNDIGSDGAKTLYFELLEADNTILIDRITYYT